MRNNLTKISCALIAGSLALSLNSCSGSLSHISYPWPNADVESKNILDGVEYVLYASRPISGNLPVNRGRLILIKADGSFETIETSGMDSAKLIWDERGIYFTDKEKDYLLTNDGLQTWDELKATGHYSLYERGDEYISLYNAGRLKETPKGSYSTQVVVRSGSMSRNFIVEGEHAASGLCEDGQVYSVAEPTGDYQDPSQPRGLEEYAVALFRVNLDAEKEELVARGGEDIGSVLSRATVCENRVLYSIMRVRDGETWEKPSLAYLLAWDTVTGEYAVRQMLDPEGEPVQASLEGGGRIAELGYHDDFVVAEDGRLHWYMGDRVFATDLATGMTEELFEVFPETVNGNVNIRFGEDDFTLFIDDHDLDYFMMTRHDRATGEELNRVELHGLLERTSPERLIPRGFAARPDGF